MEWRVHPLNPGEVLACAGVAHLAWQADRASQTGFAGEEDGRVRFCAPDLASLSGPLALEQMGPDGVRLGGIELDWWSRWGLNPSLRRWSGRQTAWTVHRALGASAGQSAPGEWLTFTGSTRGRDRGRGRLNVDPCGSWTALSLGWSPNQHERYRVCCRPWLELLASLGLQAFAVPRPRFGGGYRYRLWRPAALPVATAAFAGALGPVHTHGGYHVSTERSGSNTVLRWASPLKPPTEGESP